MLAPIPDGETVAVTTRLTGSRKVMARRETVVTGPAGEPWAVVLIDWAMTDGRAPVRIPAEFEQRADRRPRAVHPRPRGPAAEPARRDRLRLSPRLRELDPMNHANNGVYLDWLDETVAAAGADGEAATAAPPPHLSPGVPSPGRAGGIPRLDGLARRSRLGATGWPTRAARTSCAAGSIPPDRARPRVTGGTRRGAAPRRPAQDRWSVADAAPLSTTTMTFP